MLINPKDPHKKLNTKLKRPSVQGMILADPTEAADSDRIIPSIQRHLPGARIVPTGGSIYHIGMNDIFANVHSETHQNFINMGLLLDKLLMEQGDFEYSVCVHSIDALK